MVITAFKKEHHSTLSCASSIQFTHSRSFLNNHFNSHLLSATRSPQLILLVMVCNQHIWMYVLRPSHFILIDLITLTILGEVPTNCESIRNISLIVTTALTLWAAHSIAAPPGPCMFQTFWFSSTSRLARYNKGRPGIPLDNPIIYPYPSSPLLTPSFLPLYVLHPF